VGLPVWLSCFRRFGLMTLGGYRSGFKKNRHTTSTQSANPTSGGSRIEGYASIYGNNDYRAQIQPREGVESRVMRPYMVIMTTERKSNLGQSHRGAT